VTSTGKGKGEEEDHSRFILVPAAAAVVPSVQRERERKREKGGEKRVHYSCEITYFSIVGPRQMTFGIVVFSTAMQS